MDGLDDDPAEPATAGAWGTFPLYHRFRRGALLGKTLEFRLRLSHPHGRSGRSEYRFTALESNGLWDDVTGLRMVARGRIELPTP